MRVNGRILVLGAALAAAACAPRPQPAPEPAPPKPAPTPNPTPAPEPTPVRDWADLPLTSGNWSYGVEAGTAKASFAGAAGTHFSMECDRANRRVLLIRAGAESGAITLRTSYGARTLPAAPRGESLAAILAATDPLLDQLAFSRGRFSVNVPATPQLVLPAWPETARVIEDCRL